MGRGKQIFLSQFHRSHRLNHDESDFLPCLYLSRQTIMALLLR
jgi:hypothetical protein